MASILEQYRISDFLDWYRQEKLVLNPDFQRGSVWTPMARSYLIDTILRELPIPKIYLRTIVDVTTKQTIREVVDGQQRLRAILDFANDKISLSIRAEEFSGLKYSTLSEEQKEIFLSYPLSVGQLLNATNDDVLEVFSRLNSYSVQLNPPERRHAKYQGDFKWAVRTASKKWSILWEKYRIVTVRQRVRMMDDSLTAEMIGILLEGVRDGGQPKIENLYIKYDQPFEEHTPIQEKFDNTLDYLISNFAEDISGTQLLEAPHFLMLFAGFSHALYGIPEGDMDGGTPSRDSRALSNKQIALDNLLQLASILDSNYPLPRFEEFWRASKASTHRISSRRVRFQTYYRSLMPMPL